MADTVPNRKRKSEQRLDNLYKELPVSIECKGLCQGCCGPIAMSPAEFRRLSEASGKEPTIDDHGTCSLLVDGKCSAYEIRPMICRLWGMVRKMQCPFGCLPTPRFLTDEEATQFFRKVDKITGNRDRVSKSNMDGLAEIIDRKNVPR